MVKRPNKGLILILSGVFLLQIVLVFYSRDCYGGADNISHFRIARYAFKHPELFLDLWGKPVYTTLSFPFSLFGFQVARVFNVLVGIAAIFLTLKVLRLNGKDENLLTAVFIAFSPMYFLLMQSCMTEILFSLVLIFSIWLFFREKYYWAAVVLSFLPYVRSEGMVIFPILSIALILYRKYWAVPFLTVGPLFYTLVGFPHFHDWLWIIHQWPYSMGDSVYGSGSLFHFMAESPKIFGEPFLFFLIMGLIVWTLNVFKSIKLTDKSFLFWFLIVGSFMVFFAAHSYVWWKGTGNSLGLIRVIAGVVPLAAIIATAGFNTVSSWIKNTVVRVVFISIVVVAQIIVPFAQHHLPVRLDPTQALMLNASNYLRSLKAVSKIYYFDPYLVHYLGIDPFDPQLTNWAVGDKNQPSNDMNTNDLLVWDAHFGPNEGGVQLENLKNDPHLQFIKLFLPAESFKVLGGYDYGIYIFRKVDQKIIPEKKQILSCELNFDGVDKNHWVELDGKKVLKMDSGMEFSPAIQVPLTATIQVRDYMDVEATLTFILKEPVKTDNVLLILSIEVDHKSLSYNKLDLADVSGTQNSRQIVFPLKLSANFPPEAKLNLYVWNKEKKHLLVESLKLTINGY
jgi:hypothetical protein